MSCKECERETIPGDDFCDLHTLDNNEYIRLIKDIFDETDAYERMMRERGRRSLIMKQRGREGLGRV